MSNNANQTGSHIILGIDPGSYFMGFGALRVITDAYAPWRYELVSFGVISPPSTLSFNDRLGLISRDFHALLERLAPQTTVIERVFLGKNPDSAFKLGHARGVTVAAAVNTGCEIVEYAARSVKKGVTGNGAASKEQVQTVLFAALGLAAASTEAVRADASDALALAYYHARQVEVERRLRQSGRRADPAPET